MPTPFYDYSPIVRRPRLELPDGARLAFFVGVNVEHYAWGQPALSLAPFTAELVPDPVNHGWRDYGPRVGVFRIMKALADHGVPGTGILNAEVCDEYPAVVEEGTANGWTWVAHGANNSTWQTFMERDDERAYIAGVLDRIEQATGQRPRGWLGPSLTASMSTLDLLAELGCTYSLDWAIDDQPFDLKVAQGRMIGVPYSMEVNDIPAFALHHHTPDAFADTAIAAIDRLHAEGADSARVLGIGVHPFLVGQSFRIAALERILAHVTSLDGVWLTTSDAIAEWYLSQP